MKRRKYVDGAVSEYIADAESGRSTPGGGSVSALAGALGASMAQMAGNFTVGRKKFADVEEDVQSILERMAGVQAELLACVDDDVCAYGEVSAAYGLPASNDQEKEARREAIQKALVVAMEPPMRVVRACHEASLLVGALAEFANPMLVSDVGVAAALLRGAIMGAKLNVEINLAYLKDAQLRERTQIDLTRRVAEATSALEKTYAFVEKKVNS